jgi:hypothetical protein
MSIFHERPPEKKGSSLPLTLTDFKLWGQESTTVIMVIMGVAWFVEKGGRPSVNQKLYGNG